MESRIFWIFSSAVWISSIRCSTVSPTLPNFSRVFSISSFCFSTEATEFSILSLARFVSSFNLLIISVMLAEAFFVCSESWRISSATTANPFPASPARAASMEAFKASRFVWLEISIMDPTKFWTSSTFEVRLWMTCTVILLASSTFCACSFNSRTTCAPDFTVASVSCAALIIWWMPASAASVLPWILEHITACFWMASAVLSVLSAIS